MNGNVRFDVQSGSRREVLKKISRKSFGILTNLLEREIMSVTDEDIQHWEKDRYGSFPTPIGSIFEARIPTATANESSKGDHICLIVDDHPTVRTLLGVILKRRGLATLEAANAYSVFSYPG